MLVEGRSVEPGQGEVVAREVGGDPVEDHADAVAVQAIDELPQLVGRAMAWSGGEVARHLVAPGAAERMRHHRQQLDMGEAHVLGVVGELVGQLEVGEGAVAVERIQPPRAEVNLVDRYRRRQRLLLGPRSQPPLVLPPMRRLRDHGSGQWRRLGLLRVGVSLELQFTVGPEDLVLVAGAGSNVGEKYLPDPGRSEDAHRVQAPVPGVEVADDAHRARGRSPDGEGGPRDALDAHGRGHRASRRSPGGAPRRSDADPAPRSSARTHTDPRS